MPSAGDKGTSSVGEVYGHIADMKEKERTSVIDTVWKAAAFGDTDRLKEMLELNLDAAKSGDAQGYKPLHWAALNNRVAAITLLFQFGAEVDEAEPGGQTALHWAATRGALPSVELLLRSGASLHLVDSRGYTVAHVAAQYGQTALLHHLALKWDCDIDTRDNDGRTPLHWAAYKGFADPIRLLLCLGARPLLADKEGCTPLHWAAIKGHSEACTLLVQGGGAEALLVSDTTGSTPAQLAMQKGHMMCSDWLAHERARHTREAEAKSQGGLRFGMPRGFKHLAPLLWGIILGLLGMFLRFIVVYDSFGQVPWGVAAWAWVVVASSAAGLGFLVSAGVRDPGFVCSGSPDSRSKTECSEAKVGSLDDQLLWDGNWHMLCLQCRKVRPTRSKYCRVSQRCVAKFDHYCPWIGNAVGLKNHRDFVTFLVLETTAMLVALIVGIYRLALTHLPLKSLLETHTGSCMFVLFDMLMLLSVSMLTCSQLAQVFQNITTNEVINQHRYKYLHAKDGTFMNPFDKGCWPNTVEFFSGADQIESTSTEAPCAQKVEERNGLLSRHSQSRTFRNEPSMCGMLMGTCSGMCKPLHGHSHSHGQGCCKNDAHGHGRVKDIEDGL